jgi:YaiO family outer membrane protein
MKLPHALLAAVLMLSAYTASLPAIARASGHEDPPLVERADTAFAYAAIDANGDTIDASERFERTRPQFTRRTKVGLAGGFDYLTRDMEAWNEVTASFSTRLREGRTIYGYLSQQERFGRQDFEGLLGGYFRLSPSWLLVAEAKASPTHEVLPIWMAFAQIERTLGSGWRAGFGARNSVYESEPSNKSVTTANLLVEKYFSDFRAAYTLFTSNLRDNTDFRLSHLMQLGYYYGGYDEEVSSISVGFSFGVEAAEFVDPGMFGLDLKSLFLRGDHWIAPRWAITYGLRTNSQQHYSRYGITLGVDHRLGTGR